MSADIKHVFVLAMENRSFDHLFAFSGIPGVAPPDPSFGMTSGAIDQVQTDPEHEYEDVQLQIAGEPPMSGFAPRPYGAVSMAGFAKNAVPVLRTLAEQFLLFDNWFSSLPGPTWPNRFFFHAASSGGLDNSPSSVTSATSDMMDSLSFDFQNGTIFEQLEAVGRKWRVYHADLFPQVLAIKHMIDPFRLNTEQFSWLQSAGVDCFTRDLGANYDVDYTFIEPDYGLAKGGFQNGNCQHPTGSLSAGEAFIKYVYETIRNSPVWPNSLLIITYDEHGGFFDHVPPPAASPPGDDARNHDRAQNPMDCKFDQLGVRVPAVVVSPWIPPGSLGSKIFPGRYFDHSAIISTVRDCFDLPKPLTGRDAATPSIASVCSLSALRTDTPSSLNGPTTAPETTASAAMAATTAAATSSNEPPDHATEAFARIALSLDLAIAQAEKTPPIAATHPLFAAPSTPRAMPSARPEAPAALQAVAPAKSRRDQLADYMQAVSDRRRGITRGS
jgi:phospholipase C